MHFFRENEGRVIENDETTEIANISPEKNKALKEFRVRDYCTKSHTLALTLIFALPDYRTLSVTGRETSLY